MKVDTSPLPLDGDWKADLKTRSGFAFHVRPITTDDEATLTAFFAQVAQDDLRFRFLSSVKEVGAARIADMTNVDHRQTQDFVVFESGGNDIIANATLAADDKMETAEVAISLRNDMKGRGIGWSLLEHVARYARAQGIRKLLSIESRDNHAAIELEREMGFTARPFEDDPSLVVLEASLHE